MQRFSLVFALALILRPALANAQLSSAEIAKTMSEDPSLNWGTCILGALLDGSKIDLADQAVDAATRQCRLQFTSFADFMTDHNPASRDHMIKNYGDHPERLRAMAVSGAIKAYQMKQLTNAGGSLGRPDREEKK